MEMLPNNTTKRIKGIVFFLVLSQTIIAQITVNRYMGVNTLREDPIEKMKAVGFIREYHSWYLNEGNPSQIQPDYSPSYPNAVYRWNTVYQDLTYTRFGEFYDKIRNTYDLQIAPAFLGNLFQIVDPNRDTFAVDNPIVQEQKPIINGANSLDPASYVAHAAYLYHYAARYGHNTFSTNDFNNIIIPRTHSEEIPKTGLGLVEYMESWNEQDKWWWQGSHPNTYFSPQEYAAMLSADYDGHGQTLGTGVGIKNADPNMKVVMGGLAEANLDYIRQMVDWSITNRSGLNSIYGAIPFQVLNIHHYIGNNPNFLLSTQGVSPEHADLRGFLKTFDDYRDSLNAALNLDIELWLSEFGYDTYGPGSTGSPIVIAPEIGSNDSYEVQGQWIVRIYLEALAAEIDRAMLFFLRDEQTPYTGLYSSSGLLENAANNYKPKNSWFYTYTMKNVLTDMVFDSDVSPCGDTTCARVYKFTEVNNGNKVVYALWSPTASAKVFNYEFDIENVNGGHLIEMELPSIQGIATNIGTANPIISVSERPIFIVKNGNPVIGQTCTANLAVENETCASINVRLNAPNGSGTYQLWYIQGDFTATPFSHRLATLVNESVEAKDSVVTITNLAPSTTYTFFLFPEGVGQSEMSKYCQIVAQTNSSSCKIPVNPAWIFDEYKNTINPDGLFDNQNDFDPLCDANAGFPSSNDLWGFNYNLNDSMNVSLDLQAYYYIDALTIHDEGSRGYFTIQTADSPNGPWATVINYITKDYNIWKTISNIFPAHKPIRYLRFIAEKNDAAKVGELFLCGRLSSFAPDILPGIGVNGLVKDITCESLTLEWDHPFDEDILKYKILENGSLLSHVNYSAGKITIPVTSLSQNTLYEYSIITIDNANQESADTLKLVATTLAGVTSCKIPLNTSMIFDQFADLAQSQKLVDEQNSYDPLCSPYTLPNNTWGQFPYDGLKKYVSLDLQAYYDIDEIYLHDGGGISGHIDVLIADSPNGPWSNIIDYDAVKFGEWISFSEPVPNDQFVRYIRFEASDDNQVVTGEIFICGEIQSDYNPDIKPGKGRNGQINGVSCDTVGLQWAHPFDDDLKEYQIFGGSSPITIPYDANNNPTVTINGLTEDSSYSFKVVTIDLNLNESLDSLCFDFTTFTIEECNLGCNFTCPCAICLNPNWLTRTLPNTYSGQFDVGKLVNEQIKVPFCNSTGQPTSDIWGFVYDPPDIHAPAEVEIDLQQFHQIDNFHFFSKGGGVKGYVEIDYKSPDGQWIQMAYDSTGFYEWKAYGNIDIITQFFRIRLLDDNAGIGEIGICGTPYQFCPVSLDLPNPITQADTFKAGTITANAAISAGIQVGYFAENSITLGVGFHAMAGTEFLAKIDACYNNFNQPLEFDNFAKVVPYQLPLKEKNRLTIFPNPFHQSTTLAFTLIEKTNVRLDIIDIKGQIVKNLINNKLNPKGPHEINFFSDYHQGGFYLARFQVGQEIIIKKMVLIGGN